MSKQAMRSWYKKRAVGGREAVGELNLGGNRFVALALRRRRLLDR
jgi:hypothetical protein